MILELFKIMHAYHEDNQIWCTAFNDPYLYNIDIQNKTIKEVTRILDDDELGSYIYISAYKDFFIFVPYAQNMLIIMNRNTFQKEKYEIPFPQQNMNDTRFIYYFINGFINDNNLYLFGTSYAGIIKFNLLNKEFAIIDDFLKNLQIKALNERLCIFYYIQVNNKLYFPLANTNAVLEFSLIDESTKLHYVGDEQQRYISGAWDGKNIWLTPRSTISGRIIKWNLNDNTVTKYDKYCEKENDFFYPIFIHTVKVGNNIMILSNRLKMYGSKNININVETEEITAFSDFYDIRNGFGIKYACVHLKDDKFVFIDEMSVIYYDHKNNKVEIINLTPTENMKQHINQHKNDKLKFIFRPKDNGKSVQIREQYKLNLNQLIDFLKID